jgi:hypothetical protein
MEAKSLKVLCQRLIVFGVASMMGLYVLIVTRWLRNA